MPIAQTILNIEDDRGNQMSRLFRILLSRITVKHELLSTAWTTDNGQRTRVDFELCLNTN